MLEDQKNRQSTGTNAEKALRQESSGTVTMDDLLEIAKDFKMAVPESDAQLHEEIEILKESESKEHRESSRIEELRETFKISGRTDYYYIKAAETGDDAIIRKAAGAEADLIEHEQKSRYGTGGYVWEGHLASVNMQTAERARKFSQGEEDHFFRNTMILSHGERLRNEVGGSVSNWGEAAKKAMAKAEREADPAFPNRLIYKQESIIAKAEGFGITALKDGDLDAAIGALDVAGKLEDPKIITKLKEKMLELRDSENPKDRIVFQRAAKKLLELRGQQK